MGINTTIDCGNGNTTERRVYSAKVTCDDCGRELTSYDEINMSFFTDGEYEVFCNDCL